MSVFMLIQLTDLYARSLVFSMPIWFTCSQLGALFYSNLGINIFPFMVLLYMTPILSQKDQRGLLPFLLPVLQYVF